MKTTRFAQESAAQAQAEAQETRLESVFDVIFVLSKLDDHDPEKAHVLADDALLAYLKAIGHVRVAEAFEQARERIGFHYA